MSSQVSTEHQFRNVYNCGISETIRCVVIIRVNYTFALFFFFFLVNSKGYLYIFILLHIMNLIMSKNNGIEVDDFFLFECKHLSKKYKLGIRFSAEATQYV